MSEIIITYSGFILFILSTIVAIFQYRAKKKLEFDKLKLEQDYDSRKVEKEIKYNAYMQYISQIDLINQKLQNNLKSEEIFSASAEMSRKIIENPNNQVDAFKEYMDKVNRFIAEWGSEQYRTMEQLSGVKLVCGDHILDLLDEYSLVAKDYVDSTIDFMGNFMFQYPIDKEAPEIVKFKNKYENMIKLRKDIINEMRKELGINKTV